MSGLIPQEFIDNLLASTDIIEVISDCIALKKAGKNFQARCPFHQEKTPSFTANQEKQFYYCFGCGAGGNAVSFVMKYHDTDFPQAISLLAKRLGLDVPSEKEAAGAHTNKKLNPLYKIAEQANQFYQTQFNEHQESNAAKKYLHDRGITDQILQYFGIGYAPSGWNNLLQLLSNKENYAEKTLEESGLLIRHETKNNLYDRFRSRIIYPIRDLRGRVIAFGGRALGDEKPKYLNSPETPVFHKSRELYGLFEAKQANRTLEQVIVVEGYMDVIALAQHGITNTVATLGTATTSDHITKLFRQTSEIVFCFDGDEAGKKAAWRALESSLPSIDGDYRVRFLFLPEGEDPDSLIFKKGASYFNSLLEKETLTLDQYLLEHIESSISMHTLDGKAQFARQAQRYINMLPEGTYRRLLIEEISKRTGLSNSVINDLTNQSLSVPLEVKSSPSSTFTNRSTKKQVAYTPQNFSTLASPKIKVTHARLVIRILLKHPNLAAKIPLELLEKDQSHDTRMLITLIRFLHKSDLKSESGIRGSWHNTSLGNLMTEVQLLDIPESDPEKTLTSAIENLATKIKKDQEVTKPALERLQAHQKSSFQRNTKK